MDSEKTSQPAPAPSAPEQPQEYPPIREVADIMAALYLTFFLVALVRTALPCGLDNANLSPGPAHHCDGNSYYYQ